MDDDKERPTEDDLARERLGPQGVPGQSDKGKMPPQRERQTPKSGEFDGHLA